MSRALYTEGNYGSFSHITISPGRTRINRFDMIQNSPDRLTALHILIYLRQCLLATIEQDDKAELLDPAKMFDILWDVVDKNNVKGGLGRVIQNLENSAYGYASGIGWKAIIASEEEIKAALGEED